MLGIIHSRRVSRVAIVLSLSLAAGALAFFVYSLLAGSAGTSFYILLFALAMVSASVVPALDVARYLASPVDERGRVPLRDISMLLLALVAVLLVFLQPGFGVYLLLFLFLLAAVFALVGNNRRN